MAGNEFQKIYLEIDAVSRLEGDLFGKEWSQVRRQQMDFLLERPLMFKVLTEKFWGAALLNNLFTAEWWEAEQEMRTSDRRQEIEELSDMALLYLTLDSLNPNLLFKSQIELLKLGWDGTVASYCKDLGLDRRDLLPVAEKKIKINKERNPREAFILVAGEDMRTSKERMEQNWGKLKKKRDKIKKLFNRKDWWKKWLYVDGNGYVREIVR